MGSQEGLLLINSIESKELYKLLIEQINRDANLAGLDFMIKKDIAAKELVNNLSSYVYQLISKDKDAYLNFLYRVDVDERSLRDTSIDNLIQFSEKITYLILKREWQKVYFRSKNL